jgi:PilZ domain
MSLRNDKVWILSPEVPGVGATFKERRSCKRTKVNWQVEYTGVSNIQGLIHEGSRLVDYSELGACFLSMSDIQIGMQLTMHVSLPVRMARPLVFRGVVVRVEDDADVMRLFKEVAVKWQPNLKKVPVARSAQQQTPPGL